MIYEEDDEPVHVYPINDIHEHTFEGDTCACNPSVQPQEGGGVVIVHNSWDGREGLELANEVLNQ